jgi:predicted lipase
MIITDSFLCKACLLTYENDPKLDGFERDVIIVGNDTCVVFHNEENVIIAFAGSDDAKDWFENMKFCKKKTSYGSIHSGFYDSWEEVQEYLSEILHVRRLQGKKTYITGHSLGGALAMLCAIDFVYRNCIQRVVTFGSPRVGNMTWKKAYNKVCGNFKTIRYVNDQDIVTKIPTFLYWHVGSSVYFNDRGDIVKERPDSFWRIISNKIEGAFDHRLNDYYKSLLRNGL